MGLPTLAAAAAPAVALNLAFDAIHPYLRTQLPIFALETFVSSIWEAKEGAVPFGNYPQKNNPLTTYIFQDLTTFD